MQDQLQNLIQTIQNIVIPDSKHAEILRMQPSIALCVVGRVEMLTAINLNDQPMREADEIDDIATDRVLASKLVLGQAAGS